MPRYLVKVTEVRVQDAVYTIESLSEAAAASIAYGCTSDAMDERVLHTQSDDVGRVLWVVPHFGGACLAPPPPEPRTQLSLTGPELVRLYEAAIGFPVMHGWDAESLARKLSEFVSKGA